MQSFRTPALQGGEHVRPPVPRLYPLIAQPWPEVALKAYAALNRVPDELP